LTVNNILDAWERCPITVEPRLMKLQKTTKDWQTFPDEGAFQNKAMSE